MYRTHNHTCPTCHAVESCDAESCCRYQHTLCVLCAQRDSVIDNSIAVINRLNDLIALQTESIVKMKRLLTALEQECRF